LIYRQKKLIEKEKKKAAKLAELREKGLISPSSDWTIDSDTGEPLRKKAKYVGIQHKASLAALHC
jgi:hypothetical protein